MAGTWFGQSVRKDLQVFVLDNTLRVRGPRELVVVLFGFRKLFSSGLVRSAGFVPGQLAGWVAFEVDVLEDL